MNKYKLYMIFSMVVLAITIIVSTTYTWLSWSGSVNITGTGECFDVNYVKGGDIGSDSSPAKFSLASSYTGGLSTSVTVSLKSTCTITNGTGTLYLNTDTSVTSSALLNGKVLKYQVLDGSTPVEGGSGIVSSAEQTPIYSNIPITTSEKIIKVYIWIDGSLVTNDNANDILSSVYKGNITMSIESGDK